MNTVLVERRPLQITFSQEFEARLLMQPTEHTSLSDDIEQAAYRGIDHLSQVEDVRELQDTDELAGIAEQTNRYAQMSAGHFNHWVINVAQDLLDEIDLIQLTHGDDLVQLGLKDKTPATLLVYLAVAGTE